MKKWLSQLDLLDNHFVSLSACLLWQIDLVAR